jgi:hypothetical protein
MVFTASVADVQKPLPWIAAMMYAFLRTQYSENLRDSRFVLKM